MMIRLPFLWVYAGTAFRCGGRPGWFIEITLMPRPAQAKPYMMVPAALHLSLNVWRTFECYRSSGQPGHYTSVAWTGREPGSWRVQFLWWLP